MMGSVILISNLFVYVILYIAVYPGSLSFPDFFIVSGYFSTCCRPARPGLFLMFGQMRHSICYQFDCWFISHNSDMGTLDVFLVIYVIFCQFWNNTLGSTFFFHF